MKIPDPIWSIALTCFKILLPAGALIWFYCTGIEPLEPTGIAVWADDCSEIACAINRSDFDGSLFINHATNERYDLIICDSKGERLRTVLSNRGRESGFDYWEVNALFYMKSQGYILLKSQVSGSPSSLFELISMDNEIREIYRIEDGNLYDECFMIPSPKGTIFVRMLKDWNSNNSYQCSLVFLDSTGLNETNSIDPFSCTKTVNLCWMNDTIIAVNISPPSFLNIKYFTTSGEITEYDPALTCECLPTSSSEYCNGHGYVSFNGKTEKIEINTSSDSSDLCTVQFIK